MTSKLIDQACEYYGVSRLEFDGHKRYRAEDVVDARAAVAWALLQSGLTLTEISRELNYATYQQVDYVVTRVRRSPRRIREANEIAAVVR